MKYCTVDYCTCGNPAQSHTLLRSRAPQPRGEPLLLWLSLSLQLAVKLLLTASWVPLPRLAPVQ